MVSAAISFVSSFQGAICFDYDLYSLIAQLVEHSTVNRVVTGSSPVRGAIIERCPSGRRSTIGNRVGSNRVSRVRIPSSLPVWPVGQGVKTPPFHGGNRGSNPLRVTILPQSETALKSRFQSR
jgi:hypothetical protein